MAFRLSLTLILAFLFGASLLIEHEHRIDIESPTVGTFAGSSRAVCPDNENSPYSEECIAFMQGGNARLGPKGIPAEISIARSGSLGLPCAASDDVPYDTRCIRYLSGLAWQPNQANGK